MIFIEGPAILYYGAAQCSSGTGGGFSFNASAINNKLGITESGVQISISNQTMPVHTDDMGGTEGFPAEIISLAATASIRGVLVDYEAGVPGDGWKTVSKKLELGVNSSMTGVNMNPKIGASYFGDNYGFALKVLGSSSGYIFPRCSLLDSPREFTLSTGVKKISFNFTAYPIVDFTIGQTAQGYRACLYTKIDTGETFYQCHDAVGGFERYPTANNAPNTQHAPAANNNTN